MQSNTGNDDDDDAHKHAGGGGSDSDSGSDSDNSWHAGDDADSVSGGEGGGGGGGGDDSSSGDEGGDDSDGSAGAGAARNTAKHRGYAITNDDRLAIADAQRMEVENVAIEQRRAVRERGRERRTRHINACIAAANRLRAAPTDAAAVRDNANMRAWLEKDDLRNARMLGLVGVPGSDDEDGDKDSATDDDDADADADDSGGSQPKRPPPPPRRRHKHHTMNDAMRELSVLAKEERHATRWGRTAEQAAGGISCEGVDAVQDAVTAVAERRRREYALAAEGEAVLPWDEPESAGDTASETSTESAATPMGRRGRPKRRAAVAAEELTRERISIIAEAEGIVQNNKRARGAAPAVAPTVAQRMSDNESTNESLCMFLAVRALLGTTLDDLATIRDTCVLNATPGGHTQAERNVKAMRAMNKDILKLRVWYDRVCDRAIGAFSLPHSNAAFSAMFTDALSPGASVKTQRIAVREGGAAPACMFTGLITRESKDGVLVPTEKRALVVSVPDESEDTGVRRRVYVSAAPVSRIAIAYNTLRNLETHGIVAAQFKKWCETDPVGAQKSKAVEAVQGAMNALGADDDAATRADTLVRLYEAAYDTARSYMNSEDPNNSNRTPADRMVSFLKLVTTYDAQLTADAGFCADLRSVLVIHERAKAQ